MSSIQMKIPADGNGRVQIALQGGLRTCDAVAADKQEIATGTGVKVVRVQGTNTIVVEKI